MMTRPGKTGMQLVEEAKQQIQEVDVATLRQWLQSQPDLLVLDVREPNEWSQGAIEGAAGLPRGVIEMRADAVIGQLAQQKGLENPFEAPVVVYCAGGNRSALAAKTLQDMGYQKVFSLVGGFGAWANG